MTVNVLHDDADDYANDNVVCCWADAESNPASQPMQWCDLRTGPGLVLSIAMQNKKDEETQSVNLAILPLSKDNSVQPFQCPTVQCTLHMTMWLSGKCCSASASCTVPVQ